MGTVLITGASRGIGLAALQALAPQYKIIAHASRESSFDGIDLSQFPDVEVIASDLSDGGESLSETVRKEYRRDLTGLVCNAGVTLDGPIGSYKKEDIQRALNINMMSVFRLNREAMKAFSKKKKASAVNITSIVGQRGNAMQSLYAMSKAGIIGLTKSLAAEASLMRGEVRFNAVSPGFIETDMTDKVPDDHKEGYKGKTYLGRFGRPDEVGSLISFLLGEKSSYINGQIVRIDGGMW